MNQKRSHLPRVLIVTPEVTYLPDRMGSLSNCLSAKAGGLADVSASLVCELYRQGADVHIAIPNYRAIFGDCLSETLKQEQRTMRRILPDERLHLAEDHSFAHRETVYTGNGFENVRLSLAFQREVINNHSPRGSRPDPLQRLDGRPDSGCGPPVEDTLPVLGSPHPYHGNTSIGDRGSRGPHAVLAFPS